MWPNLSRSGIQAGQYFSFNLGFCDSVDGPPIFMLYVMNFIEFHHIHASLNPLSRLNKNNTQVFHRQPL